jgi:hypothetical protein
MLTLTTRPILRLTKVTGLTAEQEGAMSSDLLERADFIPGLMSNIMHFADKGYK